MIKKFNDFLNEEELNEKVLTWTKFQAESGENWERSKEFERILDWTVSGLKGNFKELAKMLGAPEELFVADRVNIKIVAERNLDTTADSSPVNQQDVKKYF